ncbi:MAG TPA: MFS transporter [Thermomicrobiales bacterium]|nr:MFS transporter [Thermomicrobiales bacterium]
MSNVERNVDSEGRGAPPPAGPIRHSSFVIRHSVYYGWYVVATVFLLLAVTSGARFLYGVVLQPVSQEFGWSYGELAGAVSINVFLLAALQPVAGWAVDRWGSRRVLLAGVVATALMTLPLTFATTLWEIYLFYGVIASLAFAATSNVNMTKLVNGWFVRRRALALSVATSGSAFGQLAIVPLATWVMVTWTWRASYWVLAGIALLLMLPLGYFVVRDAPPDATDDPTPAPDAAPRAGAHGRAPAAGADARPQITVRQALRTPAYWQLSFGFFVCGFTMSFTSVHMIPYMLDMPEHSHATMEMVASSTLAVVGGCSILGALAIGHLADRVGDRPMLALTYLLRGLAFAMLLLVGSNLTGIFLAAIVLGVSWTSTTPLTSAISADVYGRASLGMIFGFIYMAMNIGAGVGAWLAGLDHDLTGNYHLSLVLNGILGFAAAATILAVRVRPVRAAEPALALVGSRE